MTTYTIAASNWGSYGLDTYNNINVSAPGGSIGGNDLFLGTLDEISTGPGFTGPLLEFYDIDRGFFNFDLTAALSQISGPITSITLHLPQYLYFSPDSSETVGVWDVTTSAAALLAGVPDYSPPDIYNDLGSGTSYGAGTLPAEPRPTSGSDTVYGPSIAIVLNGDALAAALANPSSFNVGVSFTDLNHLGEREVFPSGDSSLVTESVILSDPTGTATHMGYLTIETNSAPVAAADSYGTNEDTTLVVSAPGVLGNDSDPDGNPITAALLSGPAHGSLAFNADGSFTYTPDPNYNGSDNFTYSASDGTLSTAATTVSLTVNSVNDPPVANPDTGTAGENETKSFDVLANDTDVDVGATKSLVSLGTVTVTSANAQIAGIDASSAFTVDGDQVKFAPGTLFDALALGDSATVVVNYTMQDDQGAQASSTLTLTVTGANDGPVANPDTGTVGENETKSFDVLANDTDADAGATKSLVSLGAVTVTSGNAQINGIDASGAFTIDGGQVKFTPGTLFDHLAVGQSATVAVNYTMQDDHNAQASSTLTLTVNGANDAPVFASGGGGTDATYELKVNFSAITKLAATDVDSGDTLSYSIVGGADQNMFKIDGNTLAFKVKPAVPHNGYQVTVQVSDGTDTDLQKITVDVTDSKMDGTFPGAGADTFVFHSGLGSNSVSNFDLAHDFLQFDHGMFAADTAAAVVAAATDDHKGNTTILDQAGDHILLSGVTKADLAAHAGDILFV